MNASLSRQRRRAEERRAAKTSTAIDAVRAAEERADQIIDELRWQPLNVAEFTDIVLIWGDPPEPQTWVVERANVPAALYLFGLRALREQQDLLGEDPPVGHVHCVVVVAGRLVPRWLRLRLLVQGGAA